MKKQRNILQLAALIGLTVLVLAGCSAKATSTKASYIVMSEHMQNSNGVSLVMISSTRSISIVDPSGEKYEGKLTAKELAALKKLVKKTEKLESTYSCRNESSDTDPDEQAQTDFVFTSELKGAKDEIRLTAYGMCIEPKELKAIDKKVSSLKSKIVKKALKGA